jgi:CheY-like chemotaxis protein/class 3 adenylate cyclase
MKALIVDDSSASRMMASKLVKSIIPDTKVDTAENGKKALLLLASVVDYDLIILDLGLPDIGGLRIIEISKDFGINCPIITISDESNQKALSDSIELGACAYLTKPMIRTQFIKCLKDHVHFKSTKVKHDILIVDDEKMNRLLLKKILKRGGYDYQEATNGFEAINLVKDNDFDCILMDIRMPHMDGIEASRRIRRDFPDVPIIVVTAEILEDVIERSEDIDIDMFLNKPISADHLLKGIKEQISKRDKMIMKSFSKSGQLGAEKPKNAILADFLKFVPRNFIDYEGLNKEIKRGLIEVIDCSVIFIDIRDFTTMTENMSADQCFNFLNSYFEMVEPIVQSFGGTVYQFLGDGIVCTFPLHKNKFTNNVVHAAISIQDKIFIYNRGRKRAGYDGIRIGCGISTGPLALGICGSSGRYDVGAFGSTMNIAARSQSACRDFGIDITITSNTYEKIEDRDNFLIRPIGKHRLKGIKNEVPLFEVFSHNDPIMRNNKSEGVDYIKSHEYNNQHLPVDVLHEAFPDDPLWSSLLNKDHNSEIH